MKGAKQMVLGRHIAIHSLVSPYPTTISQQGRKKEHYMKHHKNISKENRGIRLVEKLLRSIDLGNNL